MIDTLEVGARFKALEVKLVKVLGKKKSSITAVVADTTGSINARFNGKSCQNIWNIVSLISKLSRGKRLSIDGKVSAFHGTKQIICQNVSFLENSKQIYVTLDPDFSLPEVRFGAVAVRRVGNNTAKDDVIEFLLVRILENQTEEGSDEENMRGKISTNITSRHRTERRRRTNLADKRRICSFPQRKTN